MDDKLNKIAREARDNAVFYSAEIGNPTLEGKPETDFLLENLFAATAKTCDIIRRLTMQNEIRAKYALTKIHTALTVPDTTATDLTLTGTEFYNSVKYSGVIQSDAEIKVVFDAAALFINALILESDTLTDYDCLKAITGGNPVKMHIKSLESLLGYVTYSGKTE